MRVSPARLPFWALPGLAVLLTGVLFWQAADAMKTTERLAPEHHLTHYSMGEYRWFTGDLEAAVPHFQQAAANKPGILAAHFSLGQVLRQLGRTDEAIPPFERAVAIDPDHFESRTSLATLLFNAGRVVEACQQYEHALVLSPLNHTTLNNLAWIRATSSAEEVRNGARALVLAERASRQKDDGDPATLVTLAAACAAAGDFERALVVLERATTLAVQLGNPRLAEEVRSQFEAYRNQQALRMPHY